MLGEFEGDQTLRKVMGNDVEGFRKMGDDYERQWTINVLKGQA